MAASKRQPRKKTRSQPVRESEPKRLGKRARVEACIDIMASGSWITGVTSRELAATWGLPLSTVEGDAAEASRRVRAALEDDGTLRAQLQMTLQTITSRAIGKGELRTAVESVKVLAGITGAEAPKKVELGGSLADFLSLGMGGGSEEPPGEVDG